MFYKDDRLSLFIDGSNLYAAAKALGFDIDYKLLRQEFKIFVYIFECLP